MRIISNVHHLTKSVETALNIRLCLKTDGVLLQTLKGLECWHVRKFFDNIFCWIVPNAHNPPLDIRCLLGHFHTSAQPTSMYSFTLLMLPLAVSGLLCSYLTIEAEI